MAHLLAENLHTLVGVGRRAALCIVAVVVIRARRTLALCRRHLEPLCELLGVFEGIRWGAVTARIALL